MARKPTPHRAWRIAVMHERIRQVLSPDAEAAIDRAMEEFRIEPARRFRVIAKPVE